MNPNDYAEQFTNQQIQIGERSAKLRWDLTREQRAALVTPERFSALVYEIQNNPDTPVAVRANARLADMGYLTRSADLLVGNLLTACDLMYDDLPLPVRDEFDLILRDIDSAMTVEAERKLRQEY